MSHNIFSYTNKKKKNSADTSNLQTISRDKISNTRQPQYSSPSPPHSPNSIALLLPSANPLPDFRQEPPIRKNSSNLFLLSSLLAICIYLPSNGRNRLFLTVLDSRSRKNNLPRARWNDGSSSSEIARLALFLPARLVFISAFSQTRFLSERARERDRRRFREIRDGWRVAAIGEHSR